MGIHLKMRGARPVKRGRQDNSNQQSPQGCQYLSIAGPLGTTRDFYEELRTIMACKRQSWKGLRPPRKVRVHLIHQSVVLRDEKMTSAEASASFQTPQRRMRKQMMTLMMANPLVKQDSSLLGWRHRLQEMSWLSLEGRSTTSRSRTYIFLLRVQIWMNKHYSPSGSWSLWHIAT